MQPGMQLGVRAPQHSQVFVQLLRLEARVRGELRNRCRRLDLADAEEHGQDGKDFHGEVYGTASVADSVQFNVSSTSAPDGASTG